MKYWITNTLKTVLGFLANLAIIGYLKRFSPLVISVVQMIFFTILYTILDWIFKHIERHVEEHVLSMKSLKVIGDDNEI